MKTVSVHTEGGPYPVVIGRSILQQLPELVHRYCPVRTAAIIADSTVAGLYSAGVRTLLQNREITAHLYTFPPGEAAKNSTRLAGIHTWLIESGIRRDDCIIALGGGVTGDLAGFAAATYLRGVPLIQVPTTLLAQVDSSVGGKTGINHPLGKNLIGAFHQPRLAVIDPSVLATLPPREISAGLGEIVKYGLILDSVFTAFLSDHLETITKLADLDAVEHTIVRCCELKAEIVGRDEREHGPRRVLNFGHTFAHALEAETGYRLFRHGEAVVWGMRWACWISLHAGRISEHIFQQTEALLSRITVPNLPPGLSAAPLITCMQHDKKQSSSGLALVLLSGVGQTSIDTVTGLKDLTEKWLAYVSY